MKTFLILTAISLLLCPTANGFQGGGGESTKKGSSKKKEATTKASTTKKAKSMQTSTTNSSLSTIPHTRMNQAGIEFVFIPAGSFIMGSNNGGADEKPMHQVSISQPFYMGKYEVMQAQWQAVMGNNPSNFTECGGNCPVESVSWYDVQSFISKLNERRDGFKYRLPSEAEWEYACRAGTNGDYAGLLDDMGWYADNSGERTHRVGQKQANAFGLFDMHGNVSEWCRDWFDAKSYTSSPATDPQGPGNGKYRVERGGSWAAGAVGPRSAARVMDLPDDRDGNGAVGSVGFRVVAVAMSDETAQLRTAQTDPGALKPKKKNLTSVSSSDTDEGSIIMIVSDLPFNDYSAYRGGDRFYVLIPGTDASRVLTGLRGSGFADLRVQKRGNDVLLSFRLLAGASARVSQKFNALEITITLPVLEIKNGK